LLIIEFGLEVEAYHQQGWCLSTCGGRAVLTEDENVVYPYFGPHENVDCDQEGEKHWDEDRSINGKEPTPSRDQVSGRLLET
jgi:hypothetical protein